MLFEPFDSFLGVAHQAERQTAHSDLSAVQSCLFNSILSVLRQRWIAFVSDRLQIWAYNLSCLLGLLEVDPISTHLRAIRGCNYIGTRGHMFNNHNRFTLTPLLYPHCFAMMRFR